MDDTRAATAAKQLQRDLSLARQYAVATGTRSWVVFNTSSETWSVMAEDPNNPGRSNATVMADPATGDVYTITLGVEPFTNVQLTAAAFDGDVEVGFDWLGAPLNAAETPLAAQGSVQLSGGYSLTVEAGTGHVSYVAP